MAMVIHETVPVLRILDRDTALAFYVDYLGFRLDWCEDTNGGDPVYMRVSRGRSEIHLTGHPGEAGPNGAIYFRVTDLESHYSELKPKSAPWPAPKMTLAPWNAKLMDLTDPFGNRLRFCEELQKTD